MVKSLEEVLAYQNKNILHRFKQASPWFQGTEADAELIFEDLKRFLWLYATIEEKRRKNPELDLPDISIANAMAVIDEMWHAFILYTDLYIKFCDEYLGAFMHHPVPCEKFIANIKKMGFEEANELFVSEMVECIYEYFGEEIAVRWFDGYFKFSPPEDSGASEHHVTVV